jgi:integrase
VGLDTIDLELETLPDSIRYDRAIPRARSQLPAHSDRPEVPPSDFVIADKLRPRYWDQALLLTLPYELRHTAASLAVSRGANVKADQRTLGHASAALNLGALRRPDR